jgi:hypothetical protein
MAADDLQLDLQLKVGKMSVYPRPMKNGWPHWMASHDPCDTAVGVVGSATAVSEGVRRRGRDAGQCGHEGEKFPRPC